MWSPALAARQSCRQHRYPEYANRSSRKGGYQIEHIWADHPERHEDDFVHPADFAAYRNRVGGLVLLLASEWRRLKARLVKDRPTFQEDLNLNATRSYRSATRKKLVAKNL